MSCKLVRYGHWPGKKSGWLGLEGFESFTMKINSHNQGRPRAARAAKNRNVSLFGPPCRIFFIVFLDKVVHSFSANIYI